MASPDIYKDLTVGEHKFRLLELQPATEHGAPLTCRLVQERFDERTRKPDRPYEALSYVWGTSPKDTVVKNTEFKDTELKGTELNDTEPISCNDVEVRVGKNCCEALRHLRLPRKTRRLFVDAVCINQKDNAEKGQQVAIMGDIYARAKRVLAWLGSRCQGMDLAFRDFRRLYRFRPFLVDRKGVLKDTAAVRSFRDAVYHAKNSSILGMSSSYLRYRDG
jgi:hypothetical protein